ncbi:hypothetical protein ACQCVB_17475 [Fictibacillus phosphorivorans]|uniref:hypothetical protein n=1 Tax=Fictibacillus phosphorivorans TaxID=1221500 RepID=UPI003CF3F4D8
MNQTENRQVTFFRNGQPFQALEELSATEQEQFRTHWSKWEKKMWDSAYQHVHETLDPKKTMTLSVLSKEKD